MESGLMIWIDKANLKNDVPQSNWWPSSITSRAIPINCGTNLKDGPDPFVKVKQIGYYNKKIATNIFYHLPVWKVVMK